MPEDNNIIDVDYKKLKFKCGLEIHQQLDADNKKLFCNCPSLLRQDKPDYIVQRKLHAVAGEEGSIDLAAQYQSSLNKEFFYEGYNDTTCLVELDEEPPHQINEDALKISLQIAILMNMKIQPITQIMRKTVIDGTNTSGFQRTTLVARDGFIETDEGNFGIKFLYLEEDSARIISKEKNIDVYRLDRLGIPLVEVVTEPDIKTPKQAQKVALKIGEILRSCKVKRGIGTIRQDVSVSINNGKRVEIKGAQDIDLLPIIVEKEIKRQQKEKEVKAEVRNALPDGETKFIRPMPGSARMYPETDLFLLKISRDLINEVKKTLPKLRKEVEEELREKGLNHEMIKLLFKENAVEDFKEFLNILDKPQLIAKILLVLPKEIASHEKLSDEKINEILSKDVLSDVILSVKKKKISESQIKEVLEKIAKGESFENAIKFEKVEVSNIEERIAKIIKEKPGLSANAYMGLVMKEIKGISGKEAMEIIGKWVK